MKQLWLRVRNLPRGLKQTMKNLTQDTQTLPDNSNL